MFPLGFERRKILTGRCKELYALELAAYRCSPGVLCVNEPAIRADLFAD